jgi:membrane dipeptidase
MQQAWDTALAALQPSARDLEHGLALHASAVVIDSYGFAPTMAADTTALEAAAGRGAAPPELRDRHEEMSMLLGIDDEGERREFMDAWDAAGVTCIFQNAGAEASSVKRLLRRLAHYTRLADVMPDFCPKAVEPDDIATAHRTGRHCLYFSANGVPLADEWGSAEAELSFVRIFFQLGIREMHLTYNRRNLIGDGCAELSNGGLSDFGRAAVAELNRVGVIVDVAHSGWQTSLETAQASTGPMVASHSACNAVHEHPRGKPDEVIRAIADTGGYMGICCVPAFLGGGIERFLDHIEHVARTIGIDHVAIGTDRPYQSRQQRAQASAVAAILPPARHFETLWPPHVPHSGTEFDTETNDQSLAWTNWPLFTVGLVQRGYSDADIGKVIGGNALRVARAVYPA